MPELSLAPWATAEVASLNAFQASGVIHPFTCGSDGEPPCNSVLVATPAGWECPGCDYRQNWAISWMADGSWRDAFPAHPLEMLRGRADD